MIAFATLSWLSIIYYFLLGIGGPIFIIWFAFSYIRGMKERNKILRELVEKYKDTAPEWVGKAWIMPSYAALGEQVPS
ncbi:hypothetical protein HZF08_03160 [Paenibacillus sp. CGMCC 1.16610]|uniref:Uncharacterized protein n=1 Tax=Paenibacillus anseongense TaxID=2682845 RepID=A0ABW9U8A8_9BACL|nr:MULTISPECIES: hypothetical protein [Paenibacillus]MBA2937291.1 hypothetical protein [Paenibacillus sp. CGMCC 1.16610]MVQ36349.1 hypothetical protein [Paenibacillus anseongense]